MIILTAIFTVVLHFSCYMALSLLASKCSFIVSCCALMACSMWYRGSGFPHSAVLLHSLGGMAMCFWCFRFSLLSYFCHTNTWVDTMHHLTFINSLWTGPPITFHVACFWCVLFGLFGFCSFLLLVVLSGFLLVFWMDRDGCWSMHRSHTSSLLCHPYLMAALCMH